MAYTTPWDEASPPDIQPANQLGADIRGTKEDIRQRLGTYLSGTLAAIPTPEAIWAGLIYIATDVGQMFRWDGATWINISGALGLGKKYVNPTPVTPVVPSAGIAVTVDANTMSPGTIVDIFAGIAGPGTFEIQVGGLTVATVATVGGASYRGTLTVLDPTTAAIQGIFENDEGTGGSGEVNTLVIDITNPTLIQTYQSAGAAANHYIIAAMVKT